MTESTGVRLFPEVSERLGKYQILRQLAQGGMAEIFLATAEGIEGFEKLCVIKRALPLLASRPDTAEMFLAEARMAASLHHSNIAQVFDIGIDHGRHYFVMEFLRGEDLFRVIKKASQLARPLEFDQVVTITSSVCAALHFAHEMRDKDGTPLEIVHRDISPHNIFVSNDGTVKLCDFGIAKSAARSQQTQSGTLKGKIRYMSPEQCQEKPLDRRTDLFSLAIVMWEMVTLRPLYVRDNMINTFMSICEDPPPPPSSLRPDVPASLDAIILKGLSKRREDRYQTAREMQGALEDWARENRTLASPLRLASYMEALFGQPPATVPQFLEQITDGDDLAKRIHALNHHRESTDVELVSSDSEAPTRDGWVAQPAQEADAPSLHVGRNRSPLVVPALALLGVLSVLAAWSAVARHHEPSRVEAVASTPETPVVSRAPEPATPAVIAPAPRAPIVVPATRPDGSVPTKRMRKPMVVKSQHGEPLFLH